MVKSLYFLAIMLTAIAMGAALAHLFELPNKINLGAAHYLTDPPPLKWSDSKYGFLPEEDCNAEEETQA